MLLQEVRQKVGNVSDADFYAAVAEFLSSGLFTHEYHDQQD